MISLQVPPNIAGFFSVLATSWLSDRFKRRGIFMLAGCSLTLIGYIMLISTSRSLVQYGGTFFVSFFPNHKSLPSASLSSISLSWQSDSLTPCFQHTGRSRNLPLQPPSNGLVIQQPLPSLRPSHRDRFPDHDSELCGVYRYFYVHLRRVRSSSFLPSTSARHSLCLTRRRYRY